MSLMEHVRTVIWCATLWQWKGTSELICGTPLSQGPDQQSHEIIQGEILLMGRSNESLLVAVCVDIAMSTAFCSVLLYVQIVT